MLEKIDLTKSLSKTEYKEKMLGYESKLGKLQRECKELGIPVMIAFEGYGASGKGVQIAQLIQALDPRGFEVYAVKNETEEVYIPANIVHMDDGLFDCLENVDFIQVANGNPAYYSEFGILYHSDGRLACMPQARICK